MTTFAQGKHAYGFCERCSFRYPLRELRAETFKNHNQNNRVCPECWDEDHPQDWIGTIKINDPQSLRRPAVDIGLEDSYGFFGWAPVGNPLNYISVAVGRVVVTT